MASKSIDNVPIEIVINHIFLKLPASSLIQCRYVCKQWNQILSDPEFIRTHFKRKKQEQNQNQNRKLLFGPFFSSLECSFRHVPRKNVFFSVDIGSRSAVRLPGLKPPLDFEIVRTLGHINGITCMVVNEGMAKYRLLLGNVSTGYYKILSEPALTYRDNILGVGFAYDSYANDFKVVMIRARTQLESDVKIFSLKSDSWRSISSIFDGFNISDGYSVSGTQTDRFKVGYGVDNFIYWLREKESSITRFDFLSKKFTKLKFPCEYNRQKHHRLSIKNVGNFLCAINVCYENSEVQMWSLSKSDVWIQLMTLTLGFGPYFDFYPLCFMEDDKILFCVEYSSTDDYGYYVQLDKHVKMDRRKYMVMNPETNCVEDYVIEGISSDWLDKNASELQHYAYLDTLLLPTLLD